MHNRNAQGHGDDLDDMPSLPSRHIQGASTRLLLTLITPTFDLAKFEEYDSPTIEARKRWSIRIHAKRARGWIMNPPGSDVT